MPVISAPYAQIAPTVATLKALTAEQRVANYCLFVPALGSWVYYSATSTATANDTTVIQPTDGLGRWIVTNQSAAPSGGSGITKQPNIATAAATLTDLQRATNQIISTLTAAGIIEAPVVYTRNYDSANPTNDLINLLGTNGGTVAYSNPHSAKITNSASGIGAGTVAALTDRLDVDFHTANVANSWVQIDLSSSRTAKLTGLGLKSRIDNAAHPASVTIEGSNDGTNFTSISVWSSVGHTAPYQWRYTTFTESSSYRYIRIRQPGANASNTNFLGVSEINLYGTLSAL